MAATVQNHSAKQDTPKPLLSRRDLDSAGIRYHEEVFQGNEAANTSAKSPSGILSIPQNVEELRSDLLDFNRTVPSFCETYLTQQIDHEKASPTSAKPPATAYWPYKYGTGSVPAEGGKRLSEVQKNKIFQSLEAFENIRTWKRESERSWANVLSEYIFWTYEKQQAADAGDLKGESARRYRSAQSILRTMAHVRPVYSRNSRLRLTLYRAHDLLWSQGANAGDHEKHKQPKPDITYGFPVYSEEDLVGGSLPARLHNSPGINIFTLDFIQMVGLIGFLFAPPGKARELTEGKLKRTKLRKDDSMCLPWAVVEIKRDNDPKSTTRECYRQTANGAATALAWQETLARTLYGKELEEDLYPFVAFTCVGPKLKTWVAFTDFTDGKKIRVCVHHRAIHSLREC